MESRPFSLDIAQNHSYCVIVKNITLSIDDELYDRSRILAAQRRTTLSGMVREYLRGLSDAEERRAQARREIQDMIGRFGGKIGRIPPREERHARR